jgi:hypothetical protein
MQASALVRALALGALALAALSASAQSIWKWRDANGTVQVSDHPPPPGTPPQNILSRPGGSPAPVAMPEEAPASGAAAPAAAGHGSEDALSRKKAELEKQKADQAKAQQDAAQRAQREQQCHAAQEQLRALQSGQRLTRMNAQGEREFIDDAGRAQMEQQATAVAAQACRG